MEIINLTSIIPCLPLNQVYPDCFSGHFKNTIPRELDSSWSGEDINFLGVFWETILTVLNVPKRIQDLLSFSFHSVLFTLSSILDGDVL